MAMTRRREPAQLSMRLPVPPAPPKRGGRRAGAGRPRTRPLPEGWRPGRRFVPHLRRTAIDRHKPAHVTLRLCRIARTLRNGKLYQAIHGALHAAAEREGFRIIHYSVQGDHLHLIVEADSSRALARGMQGLGVRLARAVNRRLERKGPVLADRYHARVLANPTAVKHALLYVLNNARHHAAQRGATYPRGWLDPYSSAADFGGWRRAVRLDPDATYLPRCTAPPASWLLRGGWKRVGLLDPDGTPGPTAAPAFAAY